MGLGPRAVTGAGAAERRPPAAVVVRSRTGWRWDGVDVRHQPHDAIRVQRLRFLTQFSTIETTSSGLLIMGT